MHLDTIVEDPDVVAAVADHLGTVKAIRALSASLLLMRPGTEKRAAAEARVAELTSLIAVRAPRIGMSTNDLLIRIGSEIDERTVRGPAERELIAATMDAFREEREAQAAVTEAQARAAAATQARVAATQFAAANGIVVR